MTNLASLSGPDWNQSGQIALALWFLHQIYMWKWWKHCTVQIRSSRPPRGRHLAKHTKHKVPKMQTPRSPNAPKQTTILNVVRSLGSNFYTGLISNCVWIRQINAFVVGSHFSLAKLGPPHFAFFAQLEKSTLRNEHNWKWVLCIIFQRSLDICRNSVHKMSGVDVPIDAWMKKHLMDGTEFEACWDGGPLACCSRCWQEGRPYFMISQFRQFYIRLAPPSIVQCMTKKWLTWIKNITTN